MKFKVLLSLVALLGALSVQAGSRCQIYKVAKFEYGSTQRFVQRGYATMNSNPEYFQGCESSDRRNYQCTCVTSEEVIGSVDIEKAVAKALTGVEERVAVAVEKKLQEKFEKKLEENKKANFDALARIKQDVVKLLNDIQAIFFE